LKHSDVNTNLTASIMTALVSILPLIIVATLNLPVEASNKEHLQTSHAFQSMASGDSQPLLQNLTLSPQTVEKLKTLSQEIQKDLALQSTMFRPPLHKLRQASVIFSGPDQKGKLSAAEALAVELTRPLLRLNIKRVIDKYIGETEKNLSLVFRKAKIQEAILFLDEADALFGKRAGQSDTHDRDAKQGINHLLQYMSQFPGLIIVSTQHVPQSRPIRITRNYSIITFPCLQSTGCLPQ